MEIEKLISEMTTEEKAAIVSGTDFMYTNPIPRLGISSLSMADGPHGLRKQTGSMDNGIASSEPATAFPTAATVASSWNPENARKIGEAIGRECRYYGVRLLLGPGVNIKRNPLCGRNFEYYSEDPLPAGEMGAAQIMGLQREGVGACLKHFALNNSENYRFMGNSVADARAMREIYLRPFERIVKKAKPAAVMCAYNQIGGTYCSQNKWLLTDVLRREWGFDGAVMTDWGAMHDRVASLGAGLDLEMPGDTAVCRRQILDGLQNGSLSEKALNEAVRRVLTLVDRLSGDEAGTKADFGAHHALAGEIAEDSAVLLKNEGALPLGRGEPLLVIGDLFEKMRYQGAGSSIIHPTAVTTPKMAFDGQKIPYTYCKGYAAGGFDTEEGLLAEAMAQAERFEKVIVFAGLTDYVEGEGGDRSHMSLPENQLTLLARLMEAGKKIVVVLFGGSVMELPFADGVDAILHMLLPGQNGGTACASLLFGDKTPSGKLSETWPMSYADVPFHEDFGKTENEVYRESIFVGYRYYHTAKKQVRYPFGYGLSYTQFTYRAMSVSEEGNTVTVSADIENTGHFDGAEVVELFVKAPKTAVFKPEKELRGFTKVYLRAGECKRVSISFEMEELAYYNSRENRFVLEGGIYELELCSDIETVRLSAELAIAGETAQAPYSEKVMEIYGNLRFSEVNNGVFEEMNGERVPLPLPKTPFRITSRISDLQYTFFGNLLLRGALFFVKRQIKRAKKMPEGAGRDNYIKGAMFLSMNLRSNSLASLSMCAGKRLPYNAAEGLTALANGHLLRFFGCLMRRIRVPKLPKDEQK